MRVLFTTSHVKAHYQAMVPLGWALQAAGHEVTVAAGPDLVAHAAASGLTVLPLAEDLEMMRLGRFKHYLDTRAAAEAGTPPTTMPMHPEQELRLTSFDQFDAAAFIREHGPGLAKLVDARIDQVVRFAREWRPDLVVTEMMCFDGALAGAVVGAPVVRHLWGPLGTAETTSALADVVGDDMTGAAARYGVDLGTDPARWVIDLCPQPVEPLVSEQRLRMRYLPYNGAVTRANVPAEHGTQARICITWSESAPQLYGPEAFLVSEILHAVADLDVEVWVAIADQQRKLLRMPDHPRARFRVGRVPINQVLPTSDLAIHSGGAGVTMTAMLAGVPQLGIPFGPTFELHLDRVQNVGAAISVLPEQATVERLRTAVLEILDNPVRRERARWLRDLALELPTPAATVATLEEISTAGG